MLSDTMSLSELRRFALIPLLSLGLFTAATSYLSAAISVQLSQVGFSPSTIGATHSAYYAGMVFGALNVASIIRRLGYLSGFAFFALAFGALTALQTFFVAPESWMVLRFGAGYAMAGIYVAIESWLLASAGLHNRSLFLTCYTMTLYGMQVVSQFLFAPILSHPSLAFLVTPFLMVLCILPALCSKGTAPAMESAVRFDRASVRRAAAAVFVLGIGSTLWYLFDLAVVTKVGFVLLGIAVAVLPWRAFWRDSGYGVLLCCCSGLMASASCAFAPTYAVSLGYSASAFMVPIISGALILQWPICRLSERSEPSLVIGLGTGLLILAIKLFTLHPLGIQVALFCVGGLSFALYPVAMISMIKFSPKQSVRVASVSLFSYGIGSVAGPIAAAQFIEESGQSGLMRVLMVECIALFCISVALFIFIRCFKVGELPQCK